MPKTVEDVLAGPWHVEPDANGREGFYSVWWWDDEAGVGCEIAGRVGENKIANTIAAAPDMRSKLQEFLAVYREWRDGEHPDMSLSDVLGEFPQEVRTLLQEVESYE